MAEKNAGYYRNTAPVSPNANSDQGDSESASAAEASETSSADQAAVADFRWRSLGMGRLFALPTPDPFASKLPWAWILNTIGSDQNWFERYGMSMHRSNIGFWNFLVRGVGRPPVVWFLLLISVFMIVAGPVNYLMLRSRGKLALLLVTVPAGSFMVTICLLAYSLLSDGLGVQDRKSTRLNSSHT